MARRAQFLSSWLLLLACSHQPAVIPSLLVTLGDTALQQREGRLYYQQKVFSGWTIARYPSGDTASLIPYLNGREEGWSQEWYEGKKLQSKRFYKAGHKEGLHQGWWEEGKPKFNYHFENGDYEGEVSEWYRTGQLAKRFHYTKGQENGRQQLWWEDGKLRANYIVKEGQQFGLIGRKLCRNTLDEKTN
ncbi:MAG: variant repeat-containing protein [Flaviaesturariibacter sp.]|nr:variant repeat-containing protein [Flaviaesturariibacter sp.]